MGTTGRRIAVNIAGGFVPGLSSVIAGVTLAASDWGWEVAGIRDGFDGILFPERYRMRGVIDLTPSLLEGLPAEAGALLGTSPRTDPFRVRRVNAENLIEEVDRSDELLDRLREHGTDGVITIAGMSAMSVLYRLSRKGLKAICIPESAENDIAATQLSFGFNSALSYTAETLDRARLAAQAARKIGVVEVPGEHAGWLALQAGMTVCADAVLIPEIPYDLKAVTAKLSEKADAGRPYGLVVVAAGAVAAVEAEPQPENSLKKSLSPLATGPEGAHVIDRSGHLAKDVAEQLQRLTGQETYPLVLGQLVKGGSPTAVDRQLGLGYGAGAVRALKENQAGVMVAFQPPELNFVPLADAINKVRPIPAESVFFQIARSLGISLGAPIR